MAWDYKVIAEEATQSPGELERMLITLGGNNWELVAVQQQPHRPMSQLPPSAFFIFKRPM